MTTKLLIVDDDPEMLGVLRRHFESEGYLVSAAADGRAALETIDREDFDVVLTDLVMQDADGFAILDAIKGHEPAPRVVLMTAFASLETAIEAIRAGAYDYLTKPFKLGEASLAVSRAVDDRRLREENRRLRAAVDQRFSFDSRGSLPTRLRGRGSRQCWKYRNGGPSSRCTA